MASHHARISGGPFVYLMLAAFSATPVAGGVPAEPASSGHAATTQASKTIAPQVEVYIPSIADLVKAAKQSKSADLYRAIAGMFSLPADETGEEFDFAALTKLLEQITTWPDTSFVLATYSEDREGRLRWSGRVDWPLDDLRARVESLLKLDATAKILKDVELRRRDDGKYQIELPDVVLAVLSESGTGSLIASGEELSAPEAVFGRDYTGEPPTTQAATSAESGQEPAAEAKKPKARKKPMLVYCRLNLSGGGEDDGPSPFAAFAGVKDVRYGGTIGKDGLWNEKLVIAWNPLVGAALKTTFKKLKEPIECPRDALVMAAFNAGFSDGLADGLADLPSGTIGGRAAEGAAVAVVPGNGFLPFPDVYFQFTARSKDKIIDSIRRAIEKDTQEREEEDRPVIWHEETIDDRLVFWCNQSADGGFGLMPATYRTVVFFDAPRTGYKAEPPRLIIARTPMWADDAVRHWGELTKSAKSRIALPDSKDAHWQARISWRRVYDLVQPYLALLAGFVEGATPPPVAQELKGSLADSIISIRIDYGGLQVSGVGPVPIGALYVPVVAATSLGATGDYSSEAERERVACRHLRVLYHHAKLFKEDYGRWPATVAELDGYVDFASHSDLLYLRPKNSGFTTSLVSVIAGRTPRVVVEEEERKIDDSLYAIEWSPDDWKLRFRDGEFVNYQTIYIDTEEKIHRVPKPETAASPETEPAETKAGVEDKPDEKAESPKEPSKDKPQRAKKSKRAA